MKKTLFGLFLLFGISSFVSSADLERNQKALNRSLRVAAERGDVQAIMDLLKRGADINAQDFMDGYTPLMFAVVSNNQAAVKALLSVPEIEINMQNNEGETALIIAAMLGFGAIVQQLLDAGADVSITNMAGQTAADIASNHEEYVIANMLTMTKSARKHE